MAEQTINYGEAMFKNVDPKAVIRGVGKAAKGWWDEFSPGTIGEREVQAFENVVSHVKNEDLRALLEHKNIKTLVRGFGKLTGTTTLACDAFVATFPLYLRWSSRRDRAAAFETKAKDEAGSRVLRGEENRIATGSGKDYKKNELDNVEHKYSGIAWLRDYFSGGYRKRMDEAREKIDKQLKADAASNINDWPYRASTLRNEDIKKRIQSHKVGEAVRMVGLAGTESGIFMFRPVTRLAQLRIKATEKVGSWVVDHIVNNIVRGPNPDVAPAAPKPVS